MYRIMVVDDSMIIRNKISRLPKDSGFSIVCEAKNGQQAVELCKRYKPDIITLDITMPEMDGLEALGKLLLISPDVKVLIVSALSDQATGLEALELGAQGFLTKPFTETTLLKALNTLVSDED
ncbi:MAG: response regulator [Cardiobacteriaceae bacterium]|nr:response regulator [Cardiobacteriaceae bacterium]